MMKLNEKYNLKTTLFFSVINADRLGPFPSWMGNQVLGDTLEEETIRILDKILSRYENIDYVIFAGDIDFTFNVQVVQFQIMSLFLKMCHPKLNQIIQM